MLQAQLRSAASCKLVMERTAGGGTTDPSITIPTCNKIVFEILKEKHPEQREAFVKAFLSCDELSPLTAATHVEMEAYQIQG